MLDASRGIDEPQRIARNRGTTSKLQEKKQDGMPSRVGSTKEQQQEHEQEQEQQQQQRNSNSDIPLAAPRHSHHQQALVVPLRLRRPQYRRSSPITPQLTSKHSAA
jgi:hypothetical protein